MSTITKTSDGGTVYGADGAVLAYLQGLTAPGADTPATYATVSANGETSVGNPNTSCDYFPVTGAAAGHVRPKKKAAAIRTGLWAVQQDGVWFCGPQAARAVAALLGVSL